MELLELAETRVALRQKRVEQDKAQLATVPCSQVNLFTYIYIHIYTCKIICHR